MGFVSYQKKKKIESGFCFGLAFRIFFTYMHIQDSIRFSRCLPIMLHKSDLIQAGLSDETFTKPGFCTCTKVKYLCRYITPAYN